MIIEKNNSCSEENKLIMMTKYFVDMKIFITGGDGLLVSNLTRELLKRGHDLLVLVQPGRKAKTLDGLTIEFAQTNNGSVTGHSYAIGLTPKIHYANTQLSASYKYYFKSYKLNLQRD